MELFSLEMGFLAFMSFVLYLVILKPLLPLLYLKLKHGDQVKLLFFPLLGTIYWNLKSQKEHGHPFQWIDELSRKNPNLKAILSNQLVSPHIIFCQPKYWKQILQDHPIYQRIEFFPLDNIMLKGLGATTGEMWKRQRKLLSHAFTYEQLINRIPAIQEISKKHLEQVRPNEDLDALMYNTKISGEVMIRTFFKNSFGEQILNDRNAALEIQSLINDIILLLGSLQFLVKFLIFKTQAIKIFQTPGEKDIMRRVNLLRQKALDVIRLRISQKQDINNNDYDFLDVYLNDSSQPMTPELEDEMIQQFITFFFAGTDTTAHMMLFALYYLSQQPEMQEDLRAEVLEHYSDNCTSEQLKKLVKVNALIQESLRVGMFGDGFIPRETLQDSQIQDFYIPKGWCINMGSRFQFMNKNAFNNPYDFDIYRWLKTDDFELNSDPLKFIPFLAFNRNCIGQHLAIIEAKIIIADILSKYRVVPTVKVSGLVQKLMTEFEDNRIVQFIPL